MKKKIFFILFTIFLSLLVVETGLHIFQFFFGWLQTGSASQQDFWASPGAESSTEINNHTKYRFEFQPILGGRSGEYHAGNVNVDAYGNRTTWNPKFPGNTTPKSVYVFGGSTVWGVNGDDESTIPSYLSKMLNQSKSEFQVTNCGEMGYTFLQEIIHLTLLLREGKRPDIVLFYDGVNDVFTAYSVGRTDSSIVYEQLRVKIEESPRSDWQHIRWGVADWISHHSAIVQAFVQLSDFIQEKDPLLSHFPKYEPSDLQDLSRNIVQSYQQSLQFLDHLSHEYGFKYSCFWQPCLFTETFMTPQEKACDERLRDKNLLALYQNVNLLLKDKLRHFNNISDVFTDRAIPIYSDFCHVNSEGNRKVAEKIISILNRESFFP